MRNSKTKILITGGHHSSSLPIIELLQEKPNIEILWVGHKFSLKGDKNVTLEYKEITALGIRFVNLIAGKFYKTYNIFSLLKIPLGFFHALYIILTERPNIVLSFGGYLAVPVVIVASVLGIPCFTHEQTVVTGYANKLISRFANKVFISWKESAKYLPQEKIIYSGLPLRDEIFKPSSNNFNINIELPTIYVTAGKTGSHKINKVIEDSLGELLNIANVIHQTGQYSVYSDFENLAQKYSVLADFVKGKYHLRKFVLIDEIGEAYEKADMVVSRAGAHATFEIISLNKPALLIPIPWVSHNEQFENAKVVSQFGLGEILQEKDLNKEAFLEKIKHILNNLGEYKLAPEKSFEKVNSAEIIVNEILKQS